MNRKNFFFASILLLLIGAACKGYKVTSIVEPERISRGDEGHLTLNISTKKGYYINPESRLMIELTAPDKITLSRTSLTQEDRSPEGFSMSFKTSEEIPRGRHFIRAEITFYLCTKTECRLTTEKIKVPILVR